LPSSLASVGQFSADASGNLSTGYNDEFLEGNTLEISDALTGSYALDPGGTGRVDSQINFHISGPGPELIFYMTGNGNPALVLEADGTSGALGSGLANPQSASFSFSGKYGLSFAQGVGPLENDFTGQVTADSTAGTLSGTLDGNLDFSAQLNSPVSGTFGTPGTNGRSTGTLTNSFFPSPGSTPSTLAVAFYLIDSGHGYFVETDSTNSGELTFGYWTARTPVCSACQ